MRIGKNRCIELNQTCCCTEKFNTALSLYEVLGVTFYFSKSFLKAATRVSVVAEVLWPLRETIVCFLGQESSLWSLVPQQRHRLFSRCFLCLSLVNLPLLASLKERFTHRVLGCFLEAENKGDLEEGFLADEAARDGFALFWKAVAKPEVEAFPCFQEWDSRASFSACLTQQCLLLQQLLVTQGQMISQLAKLSSGLSSNEQGLQENSTRSPHCIAPLFI